MEAIISQPKSSPTSSGSRPTHDVTSDKELILALTQSKIYKDYERAFGETTGMAVSLRPTESWQLPHAGKRLENPFCGMMAEKSRSCAACLEVQQQICDGAHTVTCQFGLIDTAVPVRVGDKLVGFLQTGQVFRKKPTAEQFDRTAKLIAKWGVEVDGDRMKEAYFGTKVLSSKHYDAMVKLLSIFAEHISAISNQIVTQRENAEAPAITRAKHFIQENQAEHLSLGQVAKAVNTSTFYFCKMFKKATGLNFTNYVSRVRTEKAKNLLLNPNLRVSEIAYEVGFQSLTHFNRVFKAIARQSPSEYRACLTA